MIPIFFFNEKNMSEKLYEEDDVYWKTTCIL